MASEAMWRYVHPKLGRRFYLALAMLGVTLCLIALAIFLVQGMLTWWHWTAIIFYLVASTLFIAFFLWFCMRLFFARLFGNSVLVSEINYPRLYRIGIELRARLGVKKPVYIFVHEQSGFNASMQFMFGRRAIFFHSEILRRGVSDEESRWIVGRFVGYLRVRQEAGWIGRIIRFLFYVPFINFFLLPYDRAMVYTGDRLALAMIDGDVASATSAMQKLLVGRELGYSLNPQGLVEQLRRVHGTFFGFLARITTSFPHTLARYVDLLMFARVAFPEQYAKYEASNPDLPRDVITLTSWPLDRSTQLGWRATGKRPSTEAAIFIFATFIAVGGVIWYVNRDIPMREARTNSAGNWIPNAGCRWANKSPTDLRTRCD